MDWHKFVTDRKMPLYGRECHIYVVYTLSNSESLFLRDTLLWI